MTDLILIAVLLAILGGAAAYLVRAKRQGVKCIGCPEGSCQCCCGQETGCSCGKEEPLRKRMDIPPRSLAWPGSAGVLFGCTLTRKKVLCKMRMILKGNGAFQK